MIILGTLKKFGPTEIIIFPAPESCLNILVAKVWYKCKYNAIIAHYVLNKKYKNLLAEYLPNYKNQHRLLIRNLSFKCAPKTLEKECRKFGSLIEIIIPINSGKSKGFSFVQYRFPKEAKQALQNLNGLTIYGRSIVCDWALDKQLYIKKEKSEQQFKKKLLYSNAGQKKSIINFSENFLFDLNDLKDQNVEYKFLKHRVTIEVKSNQYKSISGIVPKYSTKKEKDFPMKNTLFFQAFSSEVRRKIHINRFEIFDELQYLLFTIDKYLKKFIWAGFMKFMESKSIKKILKKKDLKPIILNVIRKIDGGTFLN